MYRPFSWSSTQVWWCTDLSPDPISKWLTYRPFFWSSTQVPSPRQLYYRISFLSLNIGINGMCKMDIWASCLQWSKAIPETLARIGTKSMGSPQRRCRILASVGLILVFLPLQPRKTDVCGNSISTQFVFSELWTSVIGHDHIWCFHISRIFLLVPNWGWVDLKAEVTD